MKKGFLFLLMVLVGLTSWGQTSKSIQFRSADKAECVQNGFQSMRASFSFSSIESQDITTERGTFSALSMANTVRGGNAGEPEIPVVNELIAVPFGATPVVRVKSYSTTDYRLSDYGINRIMPRQPSVRKDMNPNEVAFVYSESAYQTRGLCSEPRAQVHVEGTMRGVRLAKLGIEPVSYDPMSNTLRVFNDIEVEVDFEGADARATEDMLLKTFSPYFNVAYQQLFNGRDIPEIYAQHPDLYQTPVTMVVITTADFQESDAFQEWVTWKIQKGFTVLVYATDGEEGIGTDSNAIKEIIDDVYINGIESGLCPSTPSFVVLIGNKYQVPNSDWIYTGEAGDYVSDMEYTSIPTIVDDKIVIDRFPEMYVSRMPVSNTTDLTNLVNKIIAYEQYTMTSTSHLNNAVFVAGVDNGHHDAHCKPAVNYATYNYFNAAHGFNNIYAHLDSYTGCYDHFGEGLGMIYYTGNGWDDYWTEPRFSTTDVTNMPDAANGKYFWAFGNCCLAANWGANVTSLAEKLLTEQNKGAFGYIGACTYSYWDEDYYFALGANPYRYNAPPVSQSTTGVFDALFMNDSYNTLNSFTLVGNLAVEYAHGYSNYEVNHNLDAEPEYYWKAYQTLGDGSVMPYQNAPRANTVSHPTILSAGATSLTVYADPDSYISLTDEDLIILAVDMVDNSGVITLELDPVSAGTLKLVVTCPQRQAYMADITVTNQAGVHNVVCTPTSNGTLSVDKASATAGEFVTLTITPDAGFSLASLTVVDANNQPVNVANNRFAMPNSDVTITATFELGLAINIASTMHGTVQASANLAVNGDRITLTATPADGYVFDQWTAFKSDDISTPVYVTNNEFVMPNYDVTISGTFKLVGGSGGNIEIGSHGAAHYMNFTYVPTRTNASYVMTEQIYQPFELGANNGNITDIAFKNMSSSSVTRNLVIYMAFTGLKNFENDTNWDWINMPSSSQVFSGNVTFQADGWTTIHLNTPFAYTSGNGILLGICDNTGYGSTQLQFDCSDEGGKRVAWVTGDSQFDITHATNYLINAQYDRNLIRFIMGVEGDPECVTVSPTSITDLQSVQYLTQNPKTVAIVGRQLNSDLTVSLSNSNFEISKTENGTYSNSLTFTPAEQSVVGMVFVRLKNNINLGNYNGTMTISCGSANQQVSLSGSVVEPEYFDIVASANPSGAGTITGAGTHIMITTQVSLTATANTGYRFLYWTEDNNVVSNDNPYNFVAEADRSLVACFETIPTYTITATANPSEGGTITGAGVLNEGSQATITAVPNSGYRFVNWYENDEWLSSEASISFSVTGNRTLVANFEEVPTCTIVATATEGGSISGNTGVVQQGTYISLTATPNNGYIFTGWTENGDQVSTNATYGFYAYNSRILVANFEAVPTYNVNVATVTNGSISVSTYNGTAGTTVTMTATAATGYTAGSWYVYKSDDVNTSVPVNGDTFTLPAYDVTVATSFREQGGGGTSGVVTIGNVSDPGESKYMPSMCYDYYSLSQQIYTPTEIGKTGTITHLAFRNNWNNSVTRSWDIYMKTTNKSNFNGGMENCSSSNLVFSGSVTIRNNNSGWSIIELDTPFSYNGQGNLLICVDDNTRVWSDPHPRFQTAMTNDGTAIRVSGDGTNYSPSSASSYNGSTDFKNIIQLTFAGSASGGSSECLAVSPNVISDFLAVAGGVASEAKAFSVVASGLENNISVTAPSHYQVCATENGTYSNSISLTPSSGDVKAMVYVKLMANLSTGQYNNEKVTLSSGDVQLQVTLNGEAADPLHVVTNSQIINGDLNLSAYNQYVITSTGKLTVNGNVNCEDPTHLIIRDGGQLIHNNNNVQATVEKSVSAWQNAEPADGWTFIATPMAAGTPVSAVQTEPVNELPTYNLYRFNDAAELEWQNASYITNLVNGQGYLYANAANKTLSFSGALNATNGYVILNKANNDHLAGWNLVGNPFPCNAYINGQFYVCNAAGDAIVTGSNPIAPCSGIMVKANSNGELLTFSKTAPVSGNYQGQLLMEVSQATRGASLMDNARLNFSDDSQLEKYYFNGNSSLYIPQDGKDYAVVSAQAEGTVPVCFKAPKSGQYKLSFSAIDTQMEYLHLIDNLTGDDVDLLEMLKQVQHDGNRLPELVSGSFASYTFNAKTTDYASRFKLVFKNKVENSSENFAIVNGKHISIVGAEGRLEVIDMMGRVLSVTDVHGSYDAELNLSAGIYVLHMNGMSQKIVVR